MKAVLLLLLLCAVACSSPKDVFAGRDDKAVVITNKELPGTNSKLFTPTQEDVLRIDAIFQKAIDDGEFYFLEPPTLQKLKERYRQYLCYLNDKNEKIVYINSYCKIPEMVYGRKLKPLKWKVEMVDTADGGSCYWKMEMNLTTGTYRYVMVNGIA